LEKFEVQLGTTILTDSFFVADFMSKSIKQVLEFRNPVVEKTSKLRKYRVFL